MFRNQWDNITNQLYTNNFFESMGILLYDISIYLRSQIEDKILPSIIILIWRFFLSLLDPSIDICSSQISEKYFGSFLDS